MRKAKSSSWVWLEKKYSKDQILEMYLNNAYFGNGAYGIGVAVLSERAQKDLTISEADCSYEEA